MAIIRFKNGIEKLADNDLIGFSRVVLTSMTDNPYFTNPVPSLAVVAQATTQFNDMVANIRAGDKSLILAKNAAKEELIQLLHNLSNYVLFIAAGNKTVAGSAGYPFAKEKVKVTISAPENFKVSMGLNKGSVHIAVSTVKGARSYVHQYTTDPNGAEGAWITHHSTTSKCLIEGLASGVPLYIRVGIVGSNGQLVFTNVQSCIPQ